MAVFMYILSASLPFISAVFIFAIVGLIYYARKNYGYLESMGIPVIKPFLFLGSNYKLSSMDVASDDVERYKQYGHIYGVYDGRTPQLVISEPKLLRLITTVDFDHFVNHGWKMGSDPFYGNILDLLTGEKWKVVRTGLTPIFTSGKIRQIATIAKEIGDEYAKILETNSNEAGGVLSGMKFKEFMAPMLIEILTKCFCGIEIPNAKHDNNPFIENMKVAMMHEVQESGQHWKNYAIKIFPFLSIFTPAFKADGMEFLLPVLKNIMEMRGKSTQGSADATHALCEMLQKVELDNDYKRLQISETTVLAQAWDFLLAGYIGLRDTFDSFMYEMALNPDIQEQLYREIQEATEDPTLESVTRLPYLSACLQETTRLHVLVERIERVCNKDWSHDGVHIPKGLQIIIPVAAIHLNPTFYPEPTKFNPDRFQPGVKEIRDQYTFFGFGHGPRGCIAQRFSLEILKLLIAIFVLKFRVVKREDTKCESNRGGILFVTYKAVILDVVRR